MDTNKIKQVIELFEESNLEKLSLEIDDMKISMEKNRGEVVREVVRPTIKHVVSEEVVQEDTSLKDWVKAPFVGTFYSASGANSEPFVKVGQKVNVGDTLCILEAMKVMNEIKADKAGTVLEIKSKNGSMVEYGEEMILIGD